MKYIVNSKEMKAYDNATIAYYQVPSMVLMERAAMAVVEEIMRRDMDLSKIAVFCGSGNNGGDGIAIARLLHLMNKNVNIIFVGKKASCTEETKHQLAIVEKYQVPILEYESDEKIDFAYTTIIDAIFGIGLTRDIKGVCKEIIEEINSSSARKIAVDIPSGIDASTGRLLGCAVRADITVTFAFYKTGLILYPGARCAGDVIVRDIGITTESMMDKKPALYTYEKKDLKKLMPRRYMDSNKGTYGKVVLVAGSHSMAGAAYLAGEAAYRMGCGLVRVITPEENREVIQTLLPEAVLTVYQKEAIDEEQFKEAIKWADVVGIGPGIRTDDTAKRLLEMVFAHAQVPVVVDADGLNLIAAKKDLMRGHKQPLVLTPHLGEMSRLTGLAIGELKENLMLHAKELAQEYKVCCVLKDVRTIVTNGSRECYLNITGNHGMSTGGSGDVLTGIICGLLAYGTDVMQAATAGVFIHGLSGDEAAKEMGTRGLLARDIAACIPKVIRID